MGTGEVRLRRRRARRAREVAVRVLVPAKPEPRPRCPHRGPHDQERRRYLRAGPVTGARPTGRLVLRPLTEWGYRRYRRTDHTPRVAYSAMRRLFAADPEGFTRLVMRAQREHPLLDGIDASAGIAGGEVDTVVAALREEGVAVLSQRLPEHECADLEATARRAECVLTTRVADGPARSSFDPEKILAVRYDLLEADVLESAAAQRLLS